MNGFFAVVSAMSAAVAAFIAAWALIGNRRDARARSRPVMFADFRKSPLAPGAYDLIVANIGGGIARHVNVEFAPGGPFVDAPEGSCGSYIHARYADELLSISPGQVLSNTYSIPKDRNLPDRITVIFSYEEIKGHRPRPFVITDEIKKRRRPYADMYSLDLSIERHASTPRPSDSDSQTRVLEELVLELSNQQFRARSR